jgi:hypothetical protein
MNSLRKLLVLGSFCCLSALPARAHETDKSEGVFCDTEVQLEQFAAYYDSNSIQDALEQVDLIAPRACGAFSAAIIRGRQVKNIRVKQGTLHLYEVLVVGLWSGQWRAVEPTIQYVAVLEQEESA